MFHRLDFSTLISTREWEDFERWRYMNVAFQCWRPRRAIWLCGHGRLSRGDLLLYRWWLCSIAARYVGQFIRSYGKRYSAALEDEEDDNILIMLLSMLHVKKMKIAIIFTLEPSTIQRRYTNSINILARQGRGRAVSLVLYIISYLAVDRGSRWWSVAAVAGRGRQYWNATFIMKQSNDICYYRLKN